MNNRFKIFVTLAMGLALSACADSHYGAKNPQVAALPDKVSLMLADAADRSANALQTLAAIEQRRTPDIAVAPIENAPPELQRAITLSWVGPAEPVLKLLADRAGYAFDMMGHIPPVPAVVTINAENKPVIEVLRDVGLQLGLRADVMVDGDRRVVELHYAPAAGVGG